MDFDMYINNITVPLKRLFGIGGFTKDHDLLMALDPDKPYNHVQLADGTSILNLNAGSIVIRNTPEWYTYKDWEHDDQRAFNIYLHPAKGASRQTIASTLYGS